MISTKDKGVNRRDGMQETLPPLPQKDGVEYRHVPGFLGYAAGTDGTLLTAMVPHKKRRMYSNEWATKSCWQNVDGYWLCSMRNQEGKERRLLAHTVILLTFVGPRPKGFDALHHNGQPHDNRLANLRWGTRKENMADSKRHGTIARRERNGHAKLTELRADAIRSLIKEGWTQRDIAALFEVSQPTICAVSNDRRWEKEAADAN